jgi:hypothetical protein
MISEKVGPKFDELVTNSREMVPKIGLSSNRQFYMLFNIGNFQTHKDSKDGGKTFEKFAQSMKTFDKVCEHYGLEWPFEKLKCEHWKLYKRARGFDKAEWIVTQYVKRS